MLVTVAVLLIIMTILVQIFQSATGTLTAAQQIQDLDNQLKLLDATIRSDLGGATAQFTPPLDPALNKGYFEYGENEFADLQGEDSDDYLRFTAKAPAGQPFTGRVWVNSPVGAAAMNNLNAQPVTVTSEFAEIIYFLRNGNLYRRVLLVAPELQSSIAQAVNNQVAGAYVFYPTAFGNNIALGKLATALSWQGVNDLSARPATTGNTGAPIVLNSLGDLTNRENRFASPRFANDFWSILAVPPGPGTDGLADDLNGDNVPDYYPSLYFGLLAATNQLIYEPGYPNVPRGAASFATMAFPYIFPGAYSNPQHLANDQYGWIHSPSPVAVDTASNTYQFDKDPVNYLKFMNHNPLDMGDNLPTPLFLPKAATFTQTWWGFPTWRETLSPNWNDPTRQVNDGVNFAQFGQPNGLSPRLASTVPVKDDGNLLPAMTAVWRNTPQLFSDGFGDINQFVTAAAAIAPGGLWGSLSWEDDLIMTNVRSFDVKAYDNLFAGYVDLGWGDDARITLQTAYLTQTPPFTTWNLQTVPTFTGTFAHEGRMPPLVEDLCFDAQSGLATNYLPANSPFLPANGGTYTGNVGDDTAGIVRLRRVWDTWSTEYSRAPATGVNAFANGFPAGPPFTPPIYPSYPPPYPAALRGIQIQIRVADPTNQRIKSLTIRQDFTDKL